MRQEQFLEVIDRDEAEKRFKAAVSPGSLESEVVPLSGLLGRVLAEDIIAPVDVPGFDRSNMDGFAVRAADTFGCQEEDPVALTLLSKPLAPGRLPQGMEVKPGGAVPIATGAMIPRGADAVVMVEHTDIPHVRGQSHLDKEEVLIYRPVAPGANISFAGTDMGQGETVLWQGTLLSSRETGVMAALGLTEAKVVRRPRVAILSTGDELIEPGATMEPGLVFDSNGTILADSIRELGGEPILMGIVPDDPKQLRDKLEMALEHDVILLSGGTSKGAGDLSYRVVGELGKPGIVAHGVALKPGKPLCLAAVQRGDRTIPVAILPGFPTSAIFTFRDLVAPVISIMAGRREAADVQIDATLPLRVSSDRGRTEYLLVGLVERSQGGWAAYPMGKGSGSVTTFSRADGFVIIPEQREYLEANETVSVHLLSQELKPAELIVVGSHCTGLDYLLGCLQRNGIQSKLLSVGSMGGLAAASRGECDLAGIHLLDPETDRYNEPFLTEDLELIPGYGRLQGIVHRKGDARFEALSVEKAMKNALADTSCAMVNRNRGSGTRALIDQLLGKAQPPGYWTEARSHNAVAAAVAQGRADWGVAIAPVAAGADLGFLALKEERFDFVAPKERLERPSVQSFQKLLKEEAIRQALKDQGFLL